MAENIIEHIIQDRVRVLTRAGKNEVGRSFGQFVLDLGTRTLKKSGETVPLTLTVEGKDGKRESVELKLPVKAAAAAPAAQHEPHLLPHPLGEQPKAVELQLEVPALGGEGGGSRLGELQLDVFGAHVSSSAA